MDPPRPRRRVPGGPPARLSPAQDTRSADAIRFLLTADVSGPVNLTGPVPVTNAEFVRRLAAAVHRPAVLPVPGPVLSLALGEFGRSSVLAGQRAVPAALERAGYRWTHRELDDAFRAALQRG